MIAPAASESHRTPRENPLWVKVSAKSYKTLPIHL
jgi:hypothetical protein